MLIRIVAGWLILATYLPIAALGGEQPAADSDSSRDAADPQARELIDALAKSVHDAASLRVSVTLAAETIVDDRPVDTQESVYQIASQSSGPYTIYLKEAQQQTRIYDDGESMIVAMGTDAYFRLSERPSRQQVVDNPPAPLGIYPAPILALILGAGDESSDFFAGSRALTIVAANSVAADGQTADQPTSETIQLHGEQADHVSWDLWVSATDPPHPIRMQVDLTEMLRASGRLEVPVGFRYQLNFEFRKWTLGGDVDSALFHFEPRHDATEYTSLREYYETVAGVGGPHPLLGEPAAEFSGTTLSGLEVSSADLHGKVVVLDFWATWCVPCVVTTPALQDVARSFADRKVVLYSVNYGELAPQVREFVDKHNWTVDPILDRDKQIADAFRLRALPQTVVIGSDGRIAAVHVGVTTTEQLTEQLEEELSELVSGGSSVVTD